MNVELEAYKAELAREILLTNSRQLLDKVRSLLKNNYSTQEDAPVLSEKEKSLAHINRAFQELKLHREDKLDFIPLEDALNEL